MLFQIGQKYSDVFGNITKIFVGNGTCSSGLPASGGGARGAEEKLCDM